MKVIFILRLWEVATRRGSVEKWFSWASNVKEPKPDQKMERGKIFALYYNLPFYGEYAFLAKVTEFKDGRYGSLVINILKYLLIDFQQICIVWI